MLVIDSQTNPATPCSTPHKIRSEIASSRSQYTNYLLDFGWILRTCWTPQGPGMLPPSYTPLHSTTQQTTITFLLDCVMVIRTITNFCRFRKLEDPLEPPSLTMSSSLSSLISLALHLLHLLSSSHLPSFSLPLPFLRSCLLCWVLSCVYFHSPSFDLSDQRQTVQHEGFFFFILRVIFSFSFFLFFFHFSFAFLINPSIGWFGILGQNFLRP